MNATIIPRKDHCVSRSDISDNALKVLRRLRDAGFDAYLVGGGVRDLLVRQAPKDFDVVTNATPEQVKSTFKNCRLIGRRFRLAHIHYGREIIEVATYRAQTAPVTHDHHRSPITLQDENIYGTLEEDAFRRDITVNALYYNIRDFSIVDYVGGYEDLKKGIIRIIGEPAVRYQEDPVRLLRVIRFAAKLDFSIEPATQAPIKTYASHLEHVPPARLFEEIVKLFLSGNAKKSYALLAEQGLLQYLFPMTALSSDTSAEFRKLIEVLLHNTDERINAAKPVTPAFLFATFLWSPLQEQAKVLQQEGMPPLPALEQAMGDVIASQSKVASIPKRLRKVMREIWFLQYRFPRRYGKRAHRLLEHPRFRAGYDFLLLREEAGEKTKNLGAWWSEFQFATEEEKIEMVKQVNRQTRRSKPKSKTKSD